MNTAAPRLTIQTARRRKAFLKVAVMGPSGAGKTYSALRLAFGIVGTQELGKVCVIDTECRSAELYADLAGEDGIGEFSTIPLGPPFTPERYIEAIQMAVNHGFEVLIIDSTSHEWNGEGGICAEKEQYDATRGGSTWTNWAHFTPRHDRFRSTVLQAPIHVIACMRQKTDWVIEQSDKGKATPRKVGLKPDQRDGSEYDFTVVLEVMMNHHAMPSKDRTKLFRGFNEVLTEAHGEQLMDWLEKGEPDEDAPVATSWAPTPRDVFADDDAGATPALPVATVQEVRTALECSNPSCGKPLTKGQHDVSLRAYGRALCPACQKQFTRIA